MLDATACAANIYCTIQSNSLQLSSRNRQFITTAQGDKDLHVFRATEKLYHRSRSLCGVQGAVAFTTITDSNQCEYDTYIEATPQYPKCPRLWLDTSHFPNYNAVYDALFPRSWGKRIPNRFVKSDLVCEIEDLPADNERRQH